MDVLDEIPMKSILRGGLFLLRGGIWCSWMLFRGFGGFAEFVSLSDMGGTYVSETASGVASPIVLNVRVPSQYLLQYCANIVKTPAISNFVDLE